MALNTSNHLWSSTKVKLQDATERYTRLNFLDCSSNQDNLYNFMKRNLYKTTQESQMHTSFENTRPLVPHILNHSLQIRLRRRRLRGIPSLLIPLQAKIEHLLPNRRRVVLRVRGGLQILDEHLPPGHIVRGHKTRPGLRCVITDLTRRSPQGDLVTGVVLVERREALVTVGPGACAVDPGRETEVGVCVEHLVHVVEKVGHVLALVAELGGRGIRPLVGGDQVLVHGDEGVGHHLAGDVDHVEFEGGVGPQGVLVFGGAVHQLPGVHEHGRVVVQGCGVVAGSAEEACDVGLQFEDGFGHGDGGCEVGVVVYGCPHDVPSLVSLFGDETGARVSAGHPVVEVLGGVDGSLGPGLVEHEVVDDFVSFLTLHRQTVADHRGGLEAGIGCVLGDVHDLTVQTHVATEVVQLTPHPGLAEVRVGALPLWGRLRVEVDDEHIRVVLDTGQISLDTLVVPERGVGVEQPALHQPDGLGVGGLHTLPSAVGHVVKVGGITGVRVVLVVLIQGPDVSHVAIGSLLLMNEAALELREVAVERLKEGIIGVLNWEACPLGALHHTGVGHNAGDVVRNEASECGQHWGHAQIDHTLHNLFLQGKLVINPLLGQVSAPGALAIAKSVPSLEGRTTEEGCNLCVGETNLMEYIDHDLLRANPGERQVHAAKSHPVQLKLPVLPRPESTGVGESH